MMKFENVVALQINALVRPFFQKACHKNGRNMIITENILTQRMES